MCATPCSNNRQGAQVGFFRKTISIIQISGGESSLKANRKVYCAVAAILSAHAAAASAAAPAATPAAESSPAAEPDSGLTIGEVVVTAQRREQSAQDVPITMTTLTAETLTRLNVTTFDDYV